MFKSVDTGYGMSSDLRELPVGTRFVVNNGNWKGKIVMENGVKCISMPAIDKVREVTGAEELSISIIND